MAGMRIGEAAALQWDDIDFETRILSITKTLYYKSMTEYHFSEPKTQAGIRDIVMDTDTIKKLKEWKEMGFDALEISERFGHESVKTTLDTYSHLYPDKDKKLAKALNKLRRPEEIT